MPKCNLRQNCCLYSLFTCLKFRIILIYRTTKLMYSLPFISKNKNIVIFSKMLVVSPGFIVSFRKPFDACNFLDIAVFIKSLLIFSDGSINAKTAY